MHRVAGRVHAFERAAGQLESRAILRDGEALALDGQDFAVQLRIQLFAVHRARAGDELGGVDHVRRAARMHHAGGARQRAHERAGAAGMIEVHVREEQEVHRVGRELQLLERREYQRNGGVGPGIDDRRPAAGHHDVRGIHLRPNIFRVDGGDAVGECRQSWHDCIHGLRQHSSMNRKLLLTLVMIGLADSSPGAVEERGNLVLDNIPSVDTPLTARLDDYMNSRGASFVDWLPDGGLLIATRFGDVEQLHRVATPLGAREQLTFYREPVTVARSPQSAVASGFVFLKDVGGNENAQVYWYDTATRAVRMLTDGKGLNGGAVWSHDGRRVAFHGTGRDGVSYDLFIAEPANNVPPRLVYNGFQKNWSVLDWSPDDTKLLVRNFVSANESHLYVLDIATAALTPVSEGSDTRERVAGAVHG